MGIRCYECQKPVVEETKYMNWLRLMNFNDFLYSEGYIELSTYEDMQNCIMTFKEFAIEDNSKEL